MDAHVFFDLEALDADLRVVNRQVVEELGLETALLLSLFTDRRAEEDDRLPSDPGQGTADRRGWWGDSYPRVEGDRIGSRLWLLEREKMTQETLARALEYIREALAWLVDDGIASRVEVSGAWEGQYPARFGRFTVVVHRPQVPEIRFQFQYVWSGVGV